MFCHAGHEAIAPPSRAMPLFSTMSRNLSSSSPKVSGPPSFYPRPAIFIVARSHHGYGRNIQIELCEIAVGDTCQTDIVNLYTGISAR